MCAYLGFAQMQFCLVGFELELISLEELDMLINFKGCWQLSLILLMGKKGKKSSLISVVYMINFEPKTQVTKLFSSMDL